MDLLIDEPDYRGDYRYIGTQAKGL
jgi:hypothetical protein